ncbi:hypothetical protein MMC29_001286 [Sticta canariensis]|nr:hypothetical protein [Sticta canariensis]
MPGGPSVAAVMIKNSGEETNTCIVLQVPAVPASSAADGMRMNRDMEVEFVPVLTRLMASQHSAELANDQLRQFQGGLVTRLRQASTQHEGMHGVSSGCMLRT